MKKKMPTKTEVINLLTTNIEKYKDVKINILYKMKLADLIDTYLQNLKIQNNQKCSKNRRKKKNL